MADLVILKEYERMWATFSTAFRKNEYTGDGDSIIGGPRWGLSAIARLTGGVAKNLSRVALDISKIIGLEHAIYNKATLHVTLRTFENYRGIVDFEDARANVYHQIIEESLRDISSFRISFKGLNITPLGVIAQGWPVGDSFQLVRDRINHGLLNEKLICGPELQQRRITAHSSLVVFGMNALNGPDNLLQYIEERRQYEFGEVEIEHLSLVAYSKKSANLEIHPIYELKLPKRL